MRRDALGHDRKWPASFDHLGRALMREHPQADLILFPSLHWPLIEAIAPLEREFGVNVMTTLQAFVWDALRLAGVNDRIEGYGRQLREF